MSTSDTIFRWIRIVRAVFLLAGGLGMIVLATFLLAEKHEGPNGDLVILLLFGLVLFAIAVWVLKRAFSRR